MDNEGLAKEILKNVGDKNNIISLVHCVTRLRFKLVEDSKANKSNIERLEGVLSVVESGGQFQVVIGNNVGDVYTEIMKLTNLDGESRKADKVAKERKGIGNRTLDLISGIFAPVLAILASVSILKGVLSILVYLNYISTTSGTYQILYVIEDSAVYFMPILVAFTAAKKFETSELTAVTLGAILVHPVTISFLNKSTGDFLGIPISGIDYSFTFIPIVIAVYMLSKLEKILNKVINENLKIFFMPLICLVIIAPLTFILIGPLSEIITKTAGIIYNFIYNLSPILLGAVIGAFWQALVIRGIHWAAMPIVINNLSLYGIDTLMACAVPGSLGQAGAVLGVLAKTKNRDIRKTAISTLPTGFLGITEPTIYGITLKYKTPFICASIGGAVGGAIVGYSGSATMGYIIPGLLTLPVYFGKGFVGLLVAIATSYLLSAVLTFITYKDPIDNKAIDVEVNEKKEISKEEKSNSEKMMNELTISSPLKGEVIELSKVSDEVFAQGALGNGIAIIPSEGRLVSPVNGVVSVVFPTGHAVAITSDEGVQILMHIGFNTVNLEGKYFKVNVEQGQTVKKGDLLVEFDIDNIYNEGFDITTPIVITNSKDYSEIISLKYGYIKVSEDILRILLD